MVGQGRGPAPRAVRRGRARPPARRCRPRSRRWRRPRRAGSTSADLLDRTRAARGRTPTRSRRRLPPLLLADRRARRRAAGAVPGARRRGRDVPRPRPRLAPRGRRPAGRGRPGAVRADPAAGRRRRPTRRRRGGVDWWEELTAAGGEGMVVKPFADLARGRRGLVQPGLKVRGREYLRIIYGPGLHRARAPRPAARARRSATSGRWPCASTRSAWRRSTGSPRGEPLWRVHEAVFAVLALESEPVDPRL